MTRRGILAWLALAFPMWALMEGCTAEGAGCGTSLGQPVTDTLWFEDTPEQLLVTDRVEVHWWPGDTLPHAVLHAWEGTVDGIEVSLDNGELMIEDRNRCGWVRRLDAVPRVDLRGMMPRELLLESQADFIMEAPCTSGDLTVEGDQMAGRMDLWFEADSLKVRLPSGIGHASAKGTAVRFSTFRSGYGDFDASALNAERVVAHQAGTGVMTLRPEGYLYLELSGAGTVYVLSEPEAQDLYVWPEATGEIIGP